jgi:hypothetical protein
VAEVDAALIPAQGAAGTAWDRTDGRWVVNRGDGVRVGALLSFGRLECALSSADEVDKEIAPPEAPMAHAARYLIRRRRQLPFLRQPSNVTRSFRGSLVAASVPRRFLSEFPDTRSAPPANGPR